MEKNLWNGNFTVGSTYTIVSFQLYSYKKDKRANCTRKIKSVERSLL